MADTLRSIAVLVAAGIAYLFKNVVDPSIADASASIVVSFIIAFSLGPLFAGLLQTGREIVDLRREATEIKNVPTDAQNVFLDQFQSLPHDIQQLKDEA